MPRRPRVSPVKLFVGLLGGDADLLRRTQQLLGRTYGAIDRVSEPRPFDATDYYAAEMGSDLLRVFVTFEPLISPETLADLKRDTIELERRVAEEALASVPRPVNIDPGYLDLTKVVLASTKDASHRIYLGGGIYAESTLRYVSGVWQPWPWTYPDYAEPAGLEWFAAVRSAYRTALQAARAGVSGDPA